MVPEAPLKRTDGGLVPEGEGWFVLNAREARWLEGEFGAYTRFEGEARFPSIGLNIGVLEPGQPACMYHGEDNQEDFLVLSGECLLLIEGEERRLKAWDFVHCPAWTEHVFVGAGEGPCAILAVGTRLSPDVVYPESELAQRHRAGVERETREPSEAYANVRDDVPVGYREGWLP
ncbi:MAG: cupin domain-containing protein [Solirubrobacterales bacterium]|nr:cupin domain-containing protein [Solirubrobacterales bacterium]MBV9797214.1 cupin domain-containing protein [Solirubrobacterales bacterium]